MRAVKFVLVLTLCAAIKCSPYDDGKYKPGKFKVYDDGKYYRPLDEGKYIPGDEGKYTYIYMQGLYPDDDGDYRYIHQTGPDGGFGGNGGYGGHGGAAGKGGFGPGGPDGPDGPPGPNGPDGPPGPDGSDPKNPKRPNKIDYIGSRTYANRYPYIHKVITALVEKYVSSDGLHFGNEYEGSTNHKVYADKEIAVKCKYLTPGFKVNETTEFVTQYPPTLKLPDGEKFGSYYSFRGMKVLNTVANSLTNKLKLEYEVFVRVVDEVSE